LGCGSVSAEATGQNVTLKTLGHLLKRLRCGLTDVFRDADGG